MDYILRYEIAKPRRKGIRGKARKDINKDPRRDEDHIYNIFKTRIKRIGVASRPAQFPKVDLPEIAFAGRSNVGKSSLLKSLSLKLVQTEVDDRPGTTRALIFFIIPKQLSIVDLPGYGFAYASEREQIKWSNVMIEYFKRRPQLRRVFILIDARHGLKNSDRELFKFLESINVKFQCIITKCDLLKPKELARQVWSCQEEIYHYKNSIKRILMVSSVTKAGVPEVMKQLSGMMNETLSKKMKLKDQNVRQKFVPLHLGYAEKVFKQTIRLEEKKEATHTSTNNHHHINDVSHDYKVDTWEDNDEKKNNSMYSINFNPVAIKSQVVKANIKISVQNSSKKLSAQKKKKKPLPKPIRKKLTLKEKYGHLL